MKRKTKAVGELVRKGEEGVYEITKDTEHGAVAKPLSLRPLTLEKAVGALLKVRPEQKSQS